MKHTTLIFLATLGLGGWGCGSNDPPAADPVSAPMGEPSSGGEEAQPPENQEADPMQGADVQEPDEGASGDEQGDEGDDGYSDDEGDEDY